MSGALDGVYIVNESAVVPTVVQSCRIEENHAALLARQAKRRHLEVSTLSSLYLKEKALEEEYPGIGFRDGAGGRARSRHADPRQRHARRNTRTNSLPRRAREAVSK